MLKLLLKENRSLRDAVSKFETENDKLKTTIATKQDENARLNAENKKLNAENKKLVGKNGNDGVEDGENQVRYDTRLTTSGVFKPFCADLEISVFPFM